MSRTVPATEAGIAEVVRVLAAGGLAVVPTMTNYNVVCDAMSGEAVRRVFAVKRRTKLGPLPVAVTGVGQFAEVVDVPSRLDLAKLAAIWPDELSFIGRQKAPFPDELSCGLRTIACGQTRHPVAARVHQGFGGPIAATSANTSGAAVRVVTLDLAREHLADQVDVYLDAGPTPWETLADGVVANTIVDLTFDPPFLCRQGVFPLDRVRALFPDIVVDPGRYQRALHARAQAGSAQAQAGGAGDRSPR